MHVQSCRFAYSRCRAVEGACRAVYMEEGRSSKAGQLFVGYIQKFRSVWCPSKKGIKDGGRQKQKCDLGPSYHNNQVLVTPNEIVGLLPSVTTKLPAAIFFLVCP